ncbi:serine protease 7 isoform X2 [Condylostylus longicornis]|nr:serine protease 7 isoform X2 [Condylostylus longicornis]
MSLYECPPLISVAMKKPLSKSDIAFLRQAECYEGFGRPPLVCCNNDVGFYNFNGLNGVNPNNDEAFPSVSSPVSQNQPRLRSNGNSATLPKPPLCGNEGISPKIYGGSDASLEEFPWMALLIYTKPSTGQMSMNCGGSLINDRYVLTAAHCLKESIFQKVGQLKYVRLGEYDITKQIDCSGSLCADSAMQVGIERLIPHENFKDNDVHRHNDIGLVKMDRSILFTDFIRPICLPFMAKSTPPSPGSELIVAGWGRTLNARRATIKQKLSVRASSLEECAEKFRAKMVNVIDTQICAGGVLREDSCDGDSGGPLMRVYKNSYVIEGIVSFGIRCGFKDWPAVHTRVSSYENWIRNNVR